MLQASGQIDLVIGSLYVLILGGIGMLMLKDALIAWVMSPRPADRGAPRHNRWVASLPLRWRFYTSGLYVSPLAPLVLGFAAGVLTILLGIGGGFILVPAMIYLLGMAARVVIGTSLVMILAVSAAATFIHAVTTQSVDIVLAALLLIGGVIGAQYGALLTTRLKPDLLRLALGNHHPAGRAAHGARPRLASRRNLLDRISMSARLASLGVAMLSPVLLGAAKPAAPVLVPDISSRRVEIRYSFTGAQLLLFGAILYPGGRAPDAAGRYRRRAEGAGAADHPAREAEDRRHLDERRFQSLPFGAVILRRRLVAPDPATGR